ncbi:pyridine nucleotide-disulfide oxidoreductase [Candidatus Acidianus copahuensis]|uniref:Pyridine nucleotide-disulfide oxidoreductase n=1 Tax=Candidatus Acidianus copahuensis TaxID=1160895 RepID=A0A031LTT7_9CREN|nr:FAD/NAD(P)-binding oxidoreductase [Candidatus Acidianus copahuensis]EZQ10548.1 pyridine nucleotide-disulfide oxidoreductase [Candidatus Acidianus copahuensis]
MKNVLVIGGGIAGMTVANALAEKKDIKVTVVTDSPYYFAGPSRPLILTNEQRYSRTIRGYEESGKRGIKVVFGHVTKVSPENREVIMSETTTSNFSKTKISYDYLVVAPGVTFDGSAINGYEKFWYNNTTVYDPGRVHVLKERIWNLNSGKVIVYAPKAPYRCAPAPTETALLLYTILKFKGVQDKVEIVHIDANDKTQPPVIADVVSKIYEKAGIKLVTNQEITEIGDNYVVTKSGEKYNFDVLAMLEPNRAPKFVEEAGLGKTWMDIRGPQDLRHPKYDDIFSAGDIANLPFPKNQEIAFETANFAANKILETESLPKNPVQYAFIGWAYMGNIEGKLETISVRFGLDFSTQPPKPSKDTEPKKEYTVQKDNWEQAYLDRLFGYKYQN